MTVNPAVEALARAMCAAVDLNPDAQFSHRFDYDPYPRRMRDREGAYVVPDVLCYSPNWYRFVWEAHKWIFENSGGELPKP